MNMRLVFYFAIISLVFQIQAQRSKIDSLELLLETKVADTTRVNWLLSQGELAFDLEDIELAKEKAYAAYGLAEDIYFHRAMAQTKALLGRIEYYKNNIRFAIKYFERSIKFYAAHYPRREADIRYELGVIQLDVGMYNDCLENFSLVSEYQSKVGDTVAHITTLGRMANAYQRMGDYQASIEVSEKGLKLAKLANAPLRAAVSLNNLGITYRNIGEPDKALGYYKQALKYAIEGENKIFQAAFIENIGIIYSNKGGYVEALKAYFKAQKIYKDLGDDASVFDLEFNIALIYKLNKEYDKAIHYYKRSLTNDKNRFDTLGIINCQHNLGSVYLSQGNYPLAKEYLLSSFNLLNTSQIDCLGGVGGLIGKLYYEQGKIDSAAYFMNLELLSIDQCENYDDYAEVSYLMGLIQEAKGNNKRAFDFFTDSYLGAKEAGYREVLKLSAFALYEWHKKRNESRQALTYHEVFQQSKDSIFNLENTRSLAWLEANYQMQNVADSLTQIKELEAKVFNDRIADQKRNQMLIIIVSLSILILVIGYYFYIRKRRELNHQLILSQTKEQGLKAVITATEAERKRIAKDLHDGVVQQIAAIKLTLASVISKLPSDQASEVTKAKEIAESAANETRNLSHQMMPKVLIEVGLVAAIEEVIENTLFSSQIHVDFQQHGLKDRYENQVEIAVYRIFQELVNNVVKHSQAKKVDVQLMENGGKLLLIVEDDGLGMTGKKQSGIGLNNIQSRLTTIDGKVDYTSGETSGTVATILIPL